MFLIPKITNTNYITSGEPRASSIVTEVHENVHVISYEMNSHVCLTLLKKEVSRPQKEEMLKLIRAT